jgi:uncharacterized membrane protein
MASSKSRSRNSGNSRNRSAAGSRSGAGSRSAARTTAAVKATPTSQRKPAGATATRSPSQVVESPEPEGMVEAAPPRVGPAPWLQWTTLVLAILGLAISAYETYAHYNGSHLAGCSDKTGGTFDCTAVITSPQSMVFNIFPVAVLGLAFYVFAVVIFSPWAWRFGGDAIVGAGGPTLRITSRGVDLVRLGSVIVGMGFVMYLIYAEFQIGEVCEYCSAVHVVTFLLFCITIVSAAIWGLGKRNPTAARL